MSLELISDGEIMKAGTCVSSHEGRHLCVVVSHTAELYYYYKAYTTELISDGETMKAGTCVSSRVTLPSCIIIITKHTRLSW